jgi:hypothetical protein
MPYINEDGSIDKNCGYIQKCDRCGKVERIYDEKNDCFVGEGESIYELNEEIRLLFKGVRKSDISGIYCFNCLKLGFPNYHKLRDIIELNIFINKLKGAINERRQQSN